MSSWDTEETRRLIRTLYGPTQLLEMVRQCISSVMYRRRYARFHFQEVKVILAAYAGIHLKSEYIANIVLLSNTAEQNKFEYCKTKIGAHVTATVQSIYELTDILVKMVYFSLRCNLLPASLIKNKCSLHTIQPFLSKNIGYSGIKVILDSILGHKEFKFLTTLVNHSNYYSLIKATLWFDATEKPQNPYTLNFQEFKYEGENYGKRLVLAFLENEHNHLSKTVTKVGSVLNSVLLMKK